MNTRIYIIENRETSAPRLVEASTHAQAMRHVAQETFTSRVASALDVAQIMGMGVRVEQASGADVPSGPTLGDVTAAERRASEAAQAGVRG